MSEVATLEARRASFEKWPVDTPVSPDSLAEDGFFNTEVDDAVVCFYCAVGMSTWEAHDVPSEQHALYSPYCGFLLQRKGRKYVDDVHRKMAADYDPSQVPSQWENIIKPHTPDTTTDEEAQSQSSDRGMCKICTTEEINIVSLPCAHMFACVQCMPLMKTCPVCRKNIQFTMRVFLS
jgi:hypothetical protein